MSVWKKISFFIFLNLAIALAVELYARANYQRLYALDNELVKSNHAFEHAAEKAQVLYLGDCKVFYSIDPSLIPIKAVSHNFSFPSERKASTYHKVKFFMEKGKLPNLKIALLHIYPERMEEDPPFNPDYDYSRFIPFTDLFAQEHPKEIFKSVLSRLSYFWRLRKNLLALPLVSQEGTMDSRGYARLDTVLDDATLVADLKNRPVRPVRAMRRDVLEYILRFQKLMENHGVRLVLFHLPEVEDYALEKKIPLKTERLDKIRRFEETIEKGFPEVPFLNLRKYADRLEIEDFADVGGHYTPKGSRKIGGQLFQEMVKANIVRADGTLVPNLYQAFNVEKGRQ